MEILSLDFTRQNGQKNQKVKGQKGQKRKNNVLTGDAGKQKKIPL